jgi:hypothetical protein
MNDDDENRERKNRLLPTPFEQIFIIVDLILLHWALTML